MGSRGFYIGAGFMHFIKTSAYMQIVPPYLPFHPALVYLSGGAEIAGGIGLLIPRLRRTAVCGLVALLIAVFPANLYMAVHNIQPAARPLPHALLWARLPVQALLIWWLLWIAKTFVTAAA